MNTLSKASALALAMLAVGTVAEAAPARPSRAAPATAPAASSAAGPVVPGVCLLSQDAVYANSKLGQAANARLQQIANSVKAELQAQRGPIDADVQALQADKAKLSAAAYTTREQALAQRAQAYQTTADQRLRQLQTTRATAVDRVLSQAQAPLVQAYTAHNCGLLVNRAAVLAGNMSNDLTPAVVQGMDARATTITFDLAPPTSATPAR